MGGWMVGWVSDLMHRLVIFNAFRWVGGLGD